MALLDWADRRVIEARHNWIMQQQLSNHFLLRRLITPQWKLLLDNFRFIPPVVELRNKDFFCPLSDQTRILEHDAIARDFEEFRRNPTDVGIRRYGP